MQDSDTDTFPEDDSIEISDLDIPDKHGAYLLVYRICNALARRYHMLTRAREMDLSSRTRVVFFSLTVMIGGGIFAYLIASSLHSKPTSVTYGTLQAVSTPGAFQIISTPVTFAMNISAANGIAYISTSDGTLSAFRASDGTLLWQSKGSIPLSQPVMMNNTIYLASQNSRGGHVDAFRANDGTLQWSYQTQTFSSQSFMVADGMVYIHTHSGMLYALRASDGKVLWHLAVNLSLPLKALLFASNGVTAVRVNTDTVYLLRTQDGSQLWRYAFNNTVSWQPEIEGGIAYIYTNANSVQAVRLNDRKVLWQYTSTSGATWSFILQNDIFYVKKDNMFLEALNAQNGTQIWQFKAKDGIQNWHPENKVVLLTTVNGFMEALSVQNGSLLWKFRPSSYSTIFWFLAGDDGLIHVIVDTPDTVLYTLQANDGKVISHQLLSNFDKNSAPGLIGDTLYTQQNNGSIDAWGSSDGKHLWNYQPPGLVIWNLIGDDERLYLQQVDGTLIILRTQDGKVAWRFLVASS